MKPIKKKSSAQSVIEYALLVAIAIIALLSINVIINLRDNAFETHFQTAKELIAPDSP